MMERLCLGLMIKLSVCGICKAKNLRYAGAMQNLVQSVCVTKDGKIVSGSWDKTVRVWDMQGKELVVCRGHEDPRFYQLYNS